MPGHFERALVLAEQNRPDEAVAELRLHLADDPDNFLAHCQLALCLIDLKRYDEATESAQLAVHLAPDRGLPHYALATVLLKRQHLPESLRAIQQAIELDPHDPDYFATLGSIHFTESRWAEALSAAENGLAIDAEHVGCSNLRAMALVKLGRREQAGATIGAALARNPENALTHANQGWTLLEARQPVKAMEHFREALRLDPEMEWARLGIVEAMKARNFIYRWMLTWFFWMAKMPPRTQWMVLLGGYFGYQAVNSIAGKNPGLAPFLEPVLIAYVIFALMTWIADPLFNLVLRTSRFGRLALSREQIIASNCLGVTLLAAVCALGAYVVTQHDRHLEPAWIVGLLLIPVSAVFRCDPGWPRKWMSVFAISMVTISLVILIPYFDWLGQGWIARVLPNGGAALVPWIDRCSGLWTPGAIAAPWVSNALIAARPRL